MKKALRLIAVLVVIGAGVVWFVTGANRGWTKTSRPIKTVEDVTGLEVISYENKFIPGLDFLGAAVLGAAALAGVSFLFRSQSDPSPKSNQHPT